MNVIVFGATGMVGAGVLIECLADPLVESTVAVVRSPAGQSHPKLREVPHTDFFDYSSLAADFAACDACFFCLGVSTVPAPLTPLLRLLLPRYWTTTENLGRAMIRVVRDGYPKRILDSVDINRLAGAPA